MSVTIPGWAYPATELEESVRQRIAPLQDVRLERCPETDDYVIRGRWGTIAASARVSRDVLLAHEAPMDLLIHRLGEGMDDAIRTLVTSHLDQELERRRGKWRSQFVEGLADAMIQRGMATYRRDLEELEERVHLLELARDEAPQWRYPWRAAALALLALVAGAIVGGLIL